MLLSLHSHFYLTIIFQVGGRWFFIHPYLAGLIEYWTVDFYAMQGNAMLVLYEADYPGRL